MKFRNIFKLNLKMINDTCTPKIYFKKLSITKINKKRGSKIYTCRYIYLKKKSKIIYIRYINVYAYIDSKLLSRIFYVKK